MQLYRHILLFTLLFATCFGAQSLDGTDITGIESIVQAVEQPDERWRKEAEDRIREHRKANIKLHIVHGGKPVTNATVRIKLTRHAFRFGGIVSARSMTYGQGSLSANEYRQHFLDFGFNTAGFNNGLKYKLRKGNETLIPELLDWFEKNRIPVRGHCLIWPGRDHMSKEMTALVEECQSDPSKKNRRKLEALCEEQIETWAPKWNVFEWDVINETRGNFHVAELLGEEIYTDWFRLARRHAVQRNAGLYLNENRVVSDPEPEVLSKKFRLYIEAVKKLLKEKAPISGLGMQSRFHAMTPAETIFDRLEELAEFDLPIAATEFEIGDPVGGDLNKAVMTERVMTVYFSHPLVNGIYAWTLMGLDNVEDSGRGVFETDGHPTLCGKVWLYLMKSHWITDEQLSTDEKGSISLRGFLGEYEITIEHNGRTKTFPLTLDKNLRQTIRL